MGQDAVGTLLEDAGLWPSATLCQTTAQSKFQLNWLQLSDLPYEEEENPHADVLGSAAKPMKIFNAADVAERALQVHGGGDLAAALATLHRLRQEQADREERLEQVKADMAARSAERAARCLARTPAERLCKQMGIDPNSQLYKTKAMQLFGLEWSWLHGLKHEERANPKNPRWAKMKLYKAADVAACALQHGTKHLMPTAQPEPLAPTLEALTVLTPVKLEGRTNS